MSTIKTIRGNIWDHVKPNTAIVIPTNGQVTRLAPSKVPFAVMGAGLAEQAAARYRELPSALGTKILLTGNHLYWFPQFNILTFPTKNHWRNDSDLELIKQSAAELDTWWFSADPCAGDQGEQASTRRPVSIQHVIIPRVGAGLGRLDWEVVKRNLLTIWTPMIQCHLTFIE